MFSALVKEVSSGQPTQRRITGQSAENKWPRVPSPHGMGSGNWGVQKTKPGDWCEMLFSEHDLVAALITSQQLGLPAQDLYRSSQSVPSMSWGGAQEAPPLAEELWVSGACWRRGNHFLEGCHHCRVPILQRLAQHPCSCGQH